MSPSLWIAATLIALLACLAHSGCRKVFLLAFSRLGVEPSNGVVIEDALVGVMAARRAGAACLAVTNTQPAQALLNAGAHRVVDSLEQMRVADLEVLVQRLR